jgi:hypothetical protein
MQHGPLFNKIQQQELPSLLSKEKTYLPSNKQKIFYRIYLSIEASMSAFSKLAFGVWRRKQQSESRELEATAESQSTAGWLLGSNY